MVSIRPDVEAELKRRGVAAVTAMLAGSVGSNPGAEVRLWVHGLPDPDRAYVEDWLGRQETDAAATAGKRHEEATKPAQEAAKYALWAVIVGAAAAVLSAIALLK
jgi:hypothetical protein